MPGSGEVFRQQRIATKKSPPLTRLSQQTRLTKGNCGTKSEGPKIEASSVSKLSPEGMPNAHLFGPRIAFAASPKTLSQELGRISAPNVM